MFEGLTTEVCVSILERELTNDENRHFDIGTTSLDIETAATGTQTHIHTHSHTKTESLLWSLY